jgi:CheY-like chemotaxis protein
MCAELNAKTVLVVDDEPVLRHTLAKLLGDVGFRVVVAPDGPAGIDLSSRAPVDLVVTDYLMPGLDGQETLDRLRQAIPGLPAIVMTALPEERWEPHPEDANPFTRWVQKPVAFCQLLTLIREALTAGTEAESAMS